MKAWNLSATKLKELSLLLFFCPLLKGRQTQFVLNVLPENRQGQLFEDNTRHHLEILICALALGDDATQLLLEIITRIAGIDLSSDESFFPLKIPILQSTRLALPVLLNFQMALFAAGKKC